MGMTMTEKFWRFSAGCEKVEPGQLIRATVDFCSRKRTSLRHSDPRI